MIKTGATGINFDLELPLKVCWCAATRILICMAADRGGHAQQAAEACLGVCLGGWAQNT